jgi:ABC-type antimicrobial peptide transport system permease subunit
VQAQDTPKPVTFANIDSILASATSSATIPTAINQMTDVLRQRHHIRAGEVDDFQIRDMTEMLGALTKATGVMSGLLLSVALISLLVGGVGIMNIMLVSVTERTREIGLRMAVGARGRDILRQFLTEAIVLCLIGGALGICLGRGTSVMVRVLMNWPIEISWPAIIASIAVSASVGLLFGYYPAWKASRLDPIEALRYE